MKTYPIGLFPGFSPGRRLQLACLLALSLAVALPGCGPKRSSAVPLSEEAAVSVLTTNVAAVPAKTQERTRAALSAMQSGNDPSALPLLAELSSSSDLDAEQRAAASAAMQAVLARLKLAAEAGNPKANAALERYRATK